MSTYITNIVDRMLKEKNLNKTFYVFIILHIFLWAALPSLTRISIDTSGDSLEVLTWGQEWQWGYFKHPPLFAWVGTAWLKIFGVSNWSFFLLSLSNIALGLYATLKLSQQFLPKREALLSVLLLEFIAFYTFTDVKLNANAILIPLVPLTSLFAYYSVTHDRYIYWILLGFFAALSMLAKYFAGVLLLSIFIALIITKEGREKFKTFKPYLAFAVFCLVLFPHIIWLINNEFLPLTYPSKHVNLNSFYIRIEQPLLIIRSTLLYWLPVVLIYYYATRDKYILKSIYKRKDYSFKSIFPLSMLLLPIIITILIGFLLGVKLSTRWLSPFFCFLGLVLLFGYGKKLSLQQSRRILLSSFIFLLVFPLLNLLIFILNPQLLDMYTYPSEKVAKVITQEWEKEFQKPMRFVTGDYYLASCLSFYSPSHPSTLIEYNYQFSPWVDKEQVSEYGIAIICKESDAACIDAASKLFNKQEFNKIHIETEQFWLSKSKAINLQYMFISPKN